MKTELVYDEDIYDITTAERGAVENVVWDSNKYVAYVQWGSGSDTIYAYNCTKSQWDEFVAKVHRSLSVGSSLRGSGWGAYFNDYSGYTNTLKKRFVEEVKTSPQDEFEVTLSFTGTVVVKVNADNLQDAIGAATSMFDNSVTDGVTEVLEAKKVT